jgi:transmembrane sensor
MTDRFQLIDGMSALDSEAHGWVRLLASGDATDLDADQCQRWCAQSPAHAAAFNEARRFWKTLKTAGDDWRADEARLAERQRARRVMTRRVMLGGALAASVAGVAAIRPPLELWPSVFELDANYRTGTGEQRQVALVEGASVQMNTRTSLSLTSDPRKIELVSGEASFEIAPQTVPFSVVAAAGRTSATNARFDVRVDGPSVRVTSLSDHVDVVLGARSVQLRAYQRVTYGRDGIGEVAAIDPAAADAWRKGLILCDNMPLRDVVAELNRYRPGRIVLMRAELGDLSVSGRFRTAEPDQALTQIQKVFGVRIRSLPGGLALVS